MSDEEEGERETQGWKVVVLLVQYTDCEQIGADKDRKQDWKESWKPEQEGI